MFRQSTKLLWHIRDATLAYLHVWPGVVSWHLDEPGAAEGERVA